MTSFAGKTVLVTGASGGIGEALAHVLAAKDARVVLLARREAELERVRSALPDPDRHVAVARDLEGADLSQLVDGIAQNVAPIDVLINNAGMSQWALAEDTSLETDRRIMEVNYFAAVALTKAVLPSMLARGSGHIVAVSSVMGKIGTPRRSAYAASKHALHGFFDCLRAEVHDRGVRVSVICPGFVDTDIRTNAATEGGAPRPARRSMAPDRFARRMVAALEREAAEALIGGPEVWSARVGAVFPGLLHWAVRGKSV